MFKKFLTLVVAASMLVANPAFSASFGKAPEKSSSGSSSGPRESAKRATPAVTESAKSSSLGGGKSVGMTRSRVTESVRDGSYVQNNQAQKAQEARQQQENRQLQEARQQQDFRNQQRNAQLEQDRRNQAAQNNNYSNNFPNNGYNNTYNNQARNNRFGMGTVAGAAAVGALVGYMMHRDSQGNSYYTHPNNPNVAYDTNGNRMSQFPTGNYSAQGTVDANGNVTPIASMASGTTAGPAYSVNQPVRESGGSGWLVFFMILLLAAIGGAVYFMFMRKKPVSSESLDPTIVHDNYNNSSITPMASSVTPRGELEDNAAQLFMDFQMNNRPSGLNFIKEASDPVLFNAIKDTVLEASDTKEVRVRNIEAEVVDVSREGSRLLGSVQYKATLEEKEGNTLTKIVLNQVWNYVYRNDRWLLAGIEPMEDEVRTETHIPVEFKF